MRITFVLPTKNIAGGVKATFELANRLQERGHEVRIVYPLIPVPPGAKRFDLQRMEDKVKGTLLNLKKGNRVDWFDLEAKLIRTLRKGTAGIPEGDVIVATWWADVYDVARCGPDKGEKFHIIRSYEVWGGPDDKVNKAYTLPLHKVAISSWLKSLIEDKFRVPVHGPIMDGIDMNVFYMEREDFTAHFPRRVGLMYRRSPLKGMRDAFQAFLMVQEEYPSVEFVLFGDPPLPEDKEAMSKLRDMEFHRIPFGGRLRSIYNSLDIFVLPSYLEGLANPPMEAMACGAACVFSDIGGMAEYSRPGEANLVFPPGQPGEMADAILTLLRDEEKRREMARAGHELVKGFSWESCTDRLEGIIREVLATSGNGS
jgi:hypothetical protein